MNVLVLSRKLFSKRVALAMFVFLVVLIGVSVESQAADRFWRTNRYHSSGFQSTPYYSGSFRSNAYTPRPVTGYGSNLHRNFTIRQQQQRSRAGGSLISRGNILWRR